MSHNSKKRFNSLNQTKSSILWAIFEKEGSILWFCQNLREKDQSLRHIQEKRFILRVIFRKKGSILWVMKKKGSISMTHVGKKGSIPWSHEKMVQFCGSCFSSKKKFNSSSHLLKEVSILWVLWVMFKKKDSFLWLMLEKWVWFVDSIEKEGSVLWVTLSKVQSFDSYFQKVQFLKVIFLKRVKSLSHIEKKKTGFNSLSQSTKGFNSLRHIQKRGFNSSSHIEKKRNNSLSHFEKNVQFFESHSRKRVQFLESNWKKVQFFESYFPKTINLFFESYIVSKRNILWVKLKKRHFSLSHVEKKCSIFWSNSVSHIEKGSKRLNS